MRNFEKNPKTRTMTHEQYEQHQASKRKGEWRKDVRQGKQSRKAVQSGFTSI